MADFRPGRWLRRRPTPTTDLTAVTCTECGAETTEWVALLWQREQGLPSGEVQPVSADDLHCWCVPCGANVEPLIRDAVLTVVGGGSE